VEEKKTGFSHRLILERRTGGTITGVRDVKSFDEKEIFLQTEEGRMQIKGEQLHVKQLNLEKGEIELEGRVDSLSYLSKNTGPKEESLLKRMFR
jgi:sporulation protein YabP